MDITEEVREYQIGIFERQSCCESVNKETEERNKRMLSGDK